MLTEWPSAAQNLVEWQRIERENTEQFLLPCTYDCVAYPDVMLELTSSDVGTSGFANVVSKTNAGYSPGKFDSDFEWLFASLRFEGMLNNRRVNLQELIGKVRVLEGSNRRNSRGTGSPRPIGALRQLSLLP
jgi:hypothetical protein